MIIYLSYPVVNDGCFTLFIDPEPQPLVREKTVREGSKKVIKCIATATHKPDVNWYRNGKMLDTVKCSSSNDVRCHGIVYEVYEEPGKHKPSGNTARTIKVLKIRSAVYPRDQGKFECVATNGHAAPARLIIDLNVLHVQGTVKLLKQCLISVSS